MRKTKTTKAKPVKRAPRKSLTEPSAARLAYSVREFVLFSGVSRATTYRMMEDGQLAFVQIRGTRRIPVSELARLGLTK
jgi:excisionase family DNA binding protein